jgi:uncharacterized membrane protein YphA (DoxX/SURF4 family)
VHPTGAVPYWLLQVLASLFLAILFLQSGIDKIVDHRGNLEYHTSHFAGTPFAGTVPLMLVVLTILETLAGVLVPYFPAHAGGHVADWDTNI